MYWPGPDGVLAETDLTGAINEEYVFFDGERIARIDRPSGTVHYYFSDHLQSLDVITDPSGTVQERCFYYPYGGQLSCTGSDPNHYKFTGKERDTESGSDYFGARYYTSNLGRFMIPDWEAKPTDVPYASFGNPQSLNLYSYVNNNPATTRDPDGHCVEVVSCTLEFGAGGSVFGPVGTIIGGAIGLGVGATIGYYGGKAIVNHLHKSDQAAPTTGQGSSQQPVVHEVDPEKTAQHVEEAQRAGKPNVLTVGDKEGKAGRRRDALAGTKPVPEKHRDEYPPAWSAEGGKGASVKPINPHDNMGDGAAQGQTIRNLAPGTKVEVRVKKKTEGQD